MLQLSCNNTNNKLQTSKAGSPVLNTKHLDHLFVPVTFPNGAKAAGIYIYAEAPDYHHVTDSDEGFTCVDDVARAAQVYLRSKTFYTDTAFQNKAINLINFLLEMQSPNGYFYNFMLLNGQINTSGKTSANNANWWSWRALQTLTEAAPIIQKINPPLSHKMDAAILRLIENIKTDLVALPLTLKEVAGISVPRFFPAGSASDQASIIILSLINYCSENKDDTLRNYIRTLADGLVMMQHGDAGKFPYGCFLSWENVWHAYGNDQGYALFMAGEFLDDTTFTESALREVDHYLPWLLKQGLLSSFLIRKTDTNYVMMDTLQFAQIAYGVRPMIFATLKAYEVAGDRKYADLAKELGGWFFGKNVAGEMMYDKNTGRCYDGILSANKVNRNAGAESTIEALLALQLMEKHHLLDSTVTHQ